LKFQQKTNVTKSSSPVNTTTHPPNSTVRRYYFAYPSGLQEIRTKNNPMNRWILLLIILLLGHNLEAQTIKGKVTDTNENALIGANISIKGTYDGTITNAEGKFEFKTSSTGVQTLSVSYIGYQPTELTIGIEKGKTLEFEVKLHEKSTQLNDVVITAGTFEAGDKKRGIQLKTLDMLTTANSNGDIFGALNTLPGTQ
jgi:hypothetical protein